MGSELATRQENYEKVRDALEHPTMKRQLEMACTSAITPERLARIALTELQRNPALQECTPQSFFGALMLCGQLGLEPGPMGLAYLIPRYNSKAGAKEVNFQPGYKGILALVWRSARVTSVNAEVVRERDEFDFAYGIPPTLRHVPATENRGDPTHAYALIGTVGGGWIMRVLAWEEVMRVRDTYSQGTSGPWYTEEEEMACKTVLVRCAKRAPVSAEAQMAVGLDELVSIGKGQGLGVGIEVPGAEEPSDD